MSTLRAKLAGGALVIGDQAFVSLANFATTVVLVRSLGLEGYGRFSLFWMGVVLVQGLQLACIGTPMMTIGPKLDSRGEGSTYYAAVLRLETAFLASGLALGALLAPAFLRVAGLAPTPGEIAGVVALGVARAGYDFARQCGLARERRRAVLGLDLCAYGAQFAILAGLALAGRLSLASALLALATPSLLGAVLGVRSLGSVRVAPGDVRVAFARHAGMSKWLVALACVQWFTSNAFAVAAGAVLGPAAVGAIKAGQTVMGVLHVLLLGIENVVPVRAAVLAAKSAWGELRRFMTRIALLGGACTLAVSCAVAGAPELLSRLLFGQSSAEQTLAIRGFAVLYVFAFGITLAAIHFRTHERTRPIFAAQALAALASVVVAHPVVEAFGLAGALCGMILQQACILAMLLLALRGPEGRRTRPAQAA